MKNIIISGNSKIAKNAVISCGDCENAALLLFSTKNISLINTVTESGEYHISTLEAGKCYEVFIDSGNAYFDARLRSKNINGHVEQSQWFQFSRPERKKTFQKPQYNCDLHIKVNIKGDVPTNDGGCAINGIYVFQDLSIQHGDSDFVPADFKRIEFPEGVHMRGKQDLDLYDELEINYLEQKVIYRQVISDTFEALPEPIVTDLSDTKFADDIIGFGIATDYINAGCIPFEEVRRFD